MSSPDSEVTSSSPLTLPEPSIARHDQKIFTKEEKAFLKDYLEKYADKCARLQSQAKPGVRGTAGIVGAKGEWVLKHVYPEFVKRFNSAGPDGPNLESLKEKLKRWFSNNHKATGEQLHRGMSPSKPRASTAIDIFAKENGEVIKQKSTKERELTQQPTQANLKIHRQVKTTMWNELTEEDQQAYKDKARAEKERLSSTPDPSHNYQRQKTIIKTTSQALRKLCGNGWDGHGAVVYFVQGVYRDQNDKYKSFSVSVSDTNQALDVTSECAEYQAFNDAFYKIAAGFLSGILFVFSV
ncbi:hypothetical protein H0H93_005979 [Arthromyces matolae]|nr:hypothetical protein H0H93_005979 [Arthromyces matolae]